MLESVFNKVAGLQVCNFVKKGLQHRCYVVKFAKLRILFFTEHLFTVTASVCFENLGKILVRNSSENPMLTGNNFTENFNADVPVGILRNL